jgi:hypothetical protein
LQIEIAQRTAFPIARALFGECRSKSGESLHWLLEGRLVGEQHVFDERIHIAFHGRGQARLPAHASDEVDHLRLVLECHQGNDIAHPAQIAR